MTRLHALVIDDNAMNVNVLTRLLNQEGVSCTQLTDPRQLDAALESLTRVDVVFLDIRMPDLSGYDVLKRLQSDTRFLCVPVVAYTAHADEIGEALSRGFHSVLVKPLDPQEFPEQLARVLRGERIK